MPFAPPRGRPLPFAAIVVAAGVALLHLAACGGGGSAQAPGSAPPPPPEPLPPSSAVSLAFIGVDVVPMDSELLLVNQTVLVRGRRIEAVGLRGDIVVPGDAAEIDGTGLVLMPGLTDMHVHLDEADLPAYLAAGITSVRNMWGHDAINDMRQRIASGTLAGPTVYSTSPGIDGPPAKWPVTQIVETPAEAEATVARLAGEGWTMLKVYQDLRPEVYAAVVAAATELGVPFMGHVPHRVGLRDVLLAGQASVEHLGGYDVELCGARGAAAWSNMNAERVPELATWTWESGTYVSPTLVVLKALSERNSTASDAATAIANRRVLVGALHDAYVPILLGTDSGIDIVVPGSSLHDELQELIASGLSPFEALAAGTVVAARFLGEEDEFGAVRAGLRADLLLLGANPLEDVTAAAEPLGVVANGSWYPQDALAARIR
jgi:imidazolonepropionase-like amidohydrolase